MDYQIEFCKFVAPITIKKTSKKQSMDIGKVIKQKSFASNSAKAMINLQYTSNLTLQSINEVFKSFGLQNQHFNVLRIIKGKHPKSVCPGEIKDVMLDKGRDLTRLIDKLEKEGHVTRNVNTLNRRMIDIELTKKGLQLLETLNKRLDQWYQENNNLTDSEAEQLSNLLDKFRG